MTNPQDEDGVEMGAGGTLAEAHLAAPDSAVDNLFSDTIVLR
jgi:hypothetical protein